MSDRPVAVGGTQGAMIYLADSLSSFRHEQAQTNTLLRELIDLVRTPPQATAAAEPEISDEEMLRYMRAEEARLAALHAGQPNGTTGPKT